MLFSLFLLLTEPPPTVQVEPSDLNEKVVRIPPRPDFTCNEDVIAVATGPKDRILYCLDTNGSLSAFDVSTQRVRWSVPAVPPGRLKYSLTVTPDGAHLLLSRRGVRLRVLESENGLEKCILPRLVSPVFSSDGSVLVAVDGRTVRRWDPVQGRELARCEAQFPLKQVAVSSDGKKAAAIYDGIRGFCGIDLSDGTVQNWPWNSERLIPFLSVGISPNGKLIALGDDWGIRLVDSVSGEPKDDFKSDVAVGAGTLQFVDGGKSLAWTHAGRRAGVLGIPTGDWLYYQTHRAGAGHLAFSMDGRSLIHVSGKQVTLEHLELKGAGLGYLSHWSVTRVFPGSSRSLTTLNEKEELTRWGPSEGTSQTFTLSHTGRIHQIVRGGTRALIRRKGGAAVVGEVPSGAVLKTLESLTSIDPAVLSMDGTVLLSSGRSEGIMIQDLEEETGRVLDLEGNLPTALAVTPDGSWAAYGDAKGTVGVINLRTLTEVVRFAPRGHRIKHILISDDASRLVTAEQGGPLLYWESVAGEPPSVLSPASPYSSPDLSPDGRSVAWVSSSQVVRLVTPKGTRSIPYPGVTAMDVAFSDGGTRLLIGGYGGVVEVALR